ncbi:hypothetical protein SSIL_1946 [Solibacillus silvestris StLB046]|uniref:Uncharacterized protein n=1 Tax=Solibacillus silvestris (strain StLB046) TaxID=1002809 RepID=F2F0X5_SOLSS|nr:hypothetical protein SSIL_1946 [Solibacillus silvestris StLB046]
MKSVAIKLYLYTLFSLLCAVGLFYLSIKFGEMAYWGNGLTWFLSLKIRDDSKNGFYSYSINLLRTLSILALGLGFLWTTFLIIAGMSGM